MAGVDNAVAAQRFAGRRIVRRKLLAIAVTLAVVDAGLLAPIGWIRWLTGLLIFVASPAALTVAIIYGRGYVRTFSIGSMFHAWAFFCWWVSKGWDRLGIPLPNDDQARAALLTFAGIIFVLLGGLLAMGVRWLVASNPVAPSLRSDKADDSTDGPLGEPRPFQFTLRTMFIVTALAALICGGLFAPSESVVVGTITGLIILVPMALTIAIVHGRGYLRTFCTGAIFPAGLLVIMSGFSTGLRDFLVGLAEDSGDQFSREMIAVVVAYYLGLTLVGGFAAMGVRWVVESPQREHKQRDEPVDAASSAATTPAE